MPDLTLNIPTLDDSQIDFDKMFNLWNQIEPDISDVLFDFCDCRFLRQNAIAFLGGLIRLAQNNDSKVKLRFKRYSKVKAHLSSNGFTEVLGLGGNHDSKTAIPFREDKDEDSDAIVKYLSSEWLGHKRIQVSDKLSNAIIGVVWEIYANAFEHSNSRIGVFSCGQYYPKMQLLKLTVVDFGIGIPANVRKFVKKKMTDVDTLKWALEPGTTTQGQETSRGLGLELLKDFIIINDGKLEILSHRGHVIISSKKESYLKRKSFFEGTLVNITIKCDTHHYQFVSESPDEIWF